MTNKHIIIYKSDMTIINDSEEVIVQFLELMYVCRYIHM